uniref:Gene unique to the Y chromosome n=1 Tax=Anopheles stephensi TaxID=30069 RepID=J9ZV99_ANOST|nr:gene unique to the Y chromosome [Anopheles stephensi]AFS60403.1 gene unique to the Y chromosome [Anopheles stephensi]
MNSQSRRYKNIELVNNLKAYLTWNDKSSFQVKHSAVTLEKKKSKTKICNVLYEAIT